MTKRKPTRKRVTMVVEVSVPREMSATQARKEVRTLISDQCNFAADPGDVKAIRVQPVGARSLGLIIDDSMFEEFL